MKKSLALLLRLLFCLIIFSTSFSGERSPVNTGSLFEEMIDMVALTRYPNPGFRIVQFSSYDHRSQVPGGPDWFANSDGFGGEPVPNFEKILKPPDEAGVGEYLIADVTGPGAVVRLWTAAISGMVRLYIDDIKKPLYEGEADAFFRRPYDVLSDLKSIDAERFRKTVYQRDASYAPIPFANRLRLVWIGNVNEIHFYQLQVRRYLPETTVVSFRPKDIVTFKDVIDRVTLLLSDPDTYLTPHSKKEAKTFETTVQPQTKQELLSLEGPGALERFSLSIKANDLDKALRQTVLHISCDGYPWGQVQSPVGDFFGAAPGINPYQSLPFTVKSDGSMTCRFVMPFQTALKIEIDNRGDQAVTVAGEVLPMDFSWDENTMHFRARWRVDHNIIASNVEVQDLPFLLAKGKGIYVGTTSLLLNPASVPTPWGNWWGEGDEKVFVDDDQIPSIFGTGSEDYYNYSWSSPDIFYFPYCGQPRNDGPGNRGFVANYRWHILDPIPCKSSLNFYMELFSHERTPGLSYARIGYHYARPGIIDDHQPLMEEDLRQLSLPAGWQPASRFGARNSVFYPAEEILKDKARTTMQPGNLWAGGKVLVWTPEKTGERKHFTLLVDQAGKKRIFITAALTPKSGKIRALLNNRLLAKDDQLIDLNSPFRTLLRNFSFEPLQLNAGEHTLTLEYLGASDDIQLPEIGVDFFWVQTLDK